VAWVGDDVKYVIIGDGRLSVDELWAIAESLRPVNMARRASM
jgi:hypothetical protein